MKDAGDDDDDGGPRLQNESSSSALIARENDDWRSAGSRSETGSRRARPDDDEKHQGGPQLPSESSSSALLAGIDTEPRRDMTLPTTARQAVVEEQPPSAETGKIAKAKTPLWAWLALVVAVIACSSGGAWFALLDDSPAIMRAAWRLWMTAVLQLPGWIRDFRRTDKELRTKYLHALPLLAFAGVALAAHFSSWSISLNLTSLSHSLLFVCTTPILLVMYQLLGFLLVKRCFAKRFEYPPTWIEVVGTLIGFGAAALLAHEAASYTGDANGNDTDSSTKYRDPSLLGDLIATLGAATMGMYLVSGATLRTWLPVWLYVFPVTLISGVLSAIASLLFEPEATFFGTTPQSLFGLFGSWDTFGLVLGAAFTAGILGHTMANLALEYVSPLIVSVLLLNEPLVGSVIGYIVGVQGPPSLITYLAGIPLMMAAGLVSLGGRDSALYAKCIEKMRQRQSKFRVLQQQESSVVQLTVT